MQRSRGAALGVVCLAVSALGHLATGCGISAFSLFLALPVAVVLGCAIADRRRSLATLVTFAVATQVLLHAVLAFGSHGTHSVHAPSLWPGIPGLLGHLAAAVIVGSLAWWFEEILQRLRCLVAHLGQAWFASVAVATPASAIPVSSPVRMATEVLAASIAPRGPPNS